ncbi:LysM peptidoglycan-binding domain-containing protein [Amycolatopsis sp. WAC 04197]|uniref:LysM peptidoglycan-binding domain-containing protein n=1 Tax=Amycolatopsis sp. WAC 04197 TaxID=2203199 RepID=UPI001F161013|nr:LysM peptidoglycan-binding domain-containing protein [Amycolatopsis sp. WAC 04197]
MLILAGPPLLLWTFRTAFLPDHVPALQEVLGWLTERDTGHVLLLVIAAAGVIAWLQLVVAIVLEGIALVRGVAAPRLPGFRWAQRLVAGVLFGLLVGATAAEASQPVDLESASIVVSQVSEHEAEPPAVGGYTVAPGDSLMSIAAEHLGDERRYQEIFDLNQGRRQADGEVLRSVDLIKPGWHLTLPPKPQCVEVVVGEGDTLTRIARKHLGSSARYREIFELNRGRPQSGGRVLDNPDLLHPGDVLRLPMAATPAKGGGASAGSAFAQAAPSCEPEPDPKPAPVHPPAPEPRAPAAKQVPAQPTVELPADSGDGVIPLVTAGLGGLLAAGILATLVRRRTLTQRRRRPGQRIRRPPTTDLEVAVRKSEDPHTAEALDLSLRALAHRVREAEESLPAVRSAVVGARGVVLQPGGQNEPFVDAQDVDELDGVRPPCPALVTLGHDLRRDLVMVNLEEVGTIVLDGATDDAEAVLLALAWELATSVWSRSLSVTLVGFGRSTAAHHPARLRHFETVDELFENDAAPTGVVLSMEPLDQEQQDGLAVVSVAGTTARDGWRLDVAGKSTVIDELGIEVELQRLTAEQAEELVGTLTAEDNAELVPVHEELDVVLEPLSVEGPELRLLGPVGLHNVDPARVEGKKINRLTELAAFLLLHPGATADEISRQLGTDTRPWSPATRQGYISRLRTWLGHDENGDLYLPNIEAKGGGYCFSNSMNSDWHRFRQLAGLGSGLALADQRTRLEAALDLVTGMPFSNVGAGRYAWSSWHQREIIDAIVDAAHALAEICQGAGDLPAARRAILRGLVAEPVSELLYRDLLRVEYRAGNLAAVRKTADKLADLASALESELDEETAALVETLLGPGEGRLTSNSPCTHSDTPR